MQCSDFENHLDEYLDASLAASGSDLDERPGLGIDAEIALHAQVCAQCEAELERRKALRLDLQALPVPSATPGFLEATVAAAATAEVAESPRRRRGDAPRRSSSRAIMGLAATVLAALLIGTVTLRDTDAPEPGLPSIALAADTVTPVKLAFSSEQALEDARLSLSLPVGVELMGYDGRSDLSWSTDLEEGTNVLRLPLVGRTAVSGYLIAKLEHPRGSKTFRLHVTVNTSGATNDE